MEISLFFLQDMTVIPRESSHFEFYYPGSDTEIRPLKESPLYYEDWYGLFNKYHLMFKNISTQHK